MNCAAIPEELIESELFGHTRGAFTGALTAKKGKFELADGGTLFLDEVGDMTPEDAGEGAARAAGAAGGAGRRHGQRRPWTCAIIAATNKDLEDEIRRGSFREDLFFRLNVIPFHVPPLRERAEDVPLLARHFMAEISAEYGRRRARSSARTRWSCSARTSGRATSASCATSSSGCSS